MHQPRSRTRQRSGNDTEILPVLTSGPKGATASVITVAAAVVMCLGYNATYAAEPASRAYEITAQPLSTALKAFAAQSDMQIIFTEVDVGQAQTAGVSGNLSPRDALSEILKGTDLEFELTANKVIVVKKSSSRAASTPLSAVREESERLHRTGSSMRLAQAETASDSSRRANETSEAGVAGRAEDVGGNNDRLTLDEIVVTGTRLVRTNLEAPTPVMSLSADDILASGKSSVGDVVSAMPQFSPRLNSVGSVRAVGGTAGVNEIDFRSLGTHRTLVLVDGRRHVGFGASGSVDITSIPTDIVERVEVITGGASAIYGADAVAGVVNFITRKDFEGLTGRAQAGWNEDGKAGNVMASLTAGQNFHEGRGNALISLEYGRTSSMMLSEADHARNTVFTPNPLNGDTIGPDGKAINDGIPDLIFVDNARLGLANEGGVIGHPFFGGLPSGNVYHFDGNGNALPYDWMGQGLYAGGIVSQGGDGAPFFDPYIDLQPKQDRYGVNTRLTYELSPALEVFGEAKFTNVESTTRGLPPVLESDSIFTVSTDNPFMPAQIRDELLDDGLPLAVMSRFNAEFPRGERNEFKTSRAVAGARGRISDDWEYNLSFVYGRSKGRMALGGIIDMDRFTRSVDVVTDTAGVLGAAGTAVCRETLDNALAAAPSTDPGITGCVAANVFGPGNISQQARAYISTLGIIETDRRQVVASFDVTGSTRNWFELPGGPVALAIGAEYRDESFESRANEAQMNFITGFRPTDGSFDVSEGFLEVSAPLLANLPFVHDLTIDAAVRASSYGTIGDTTSWKGGLVWAPIEMLRLRGTLATAVRAPHINELFQPQTRGSTTNQYDPCNLTNIGINANRTANCAALGVPEGFNETIGSRFYQVISGGNPDLEEESTDTLTAGLTLRPTDALALTVDYWSIKIENVINSFSTLQILNACVDGPTLNDQFCSAIQRDLTGASGVQPGAVTTIDTFIRNGSFLETAGIDFEAAYRMPQNLGGMDLRLRGTWLDKFISKPVQGSDLATARQEGTGGFSEWRLMFDATWRWDRARLNYGVRYASGTLRFPRETYIDNEDQIYPAKRADSVIHDLRAAWTLRHGVEVYAGVNNLFDEDPPRGASESQSLDRGFYDPIGRFYYSGVQVRL